MLQGFFSILYTLTPPKPPCANGAVVTHKNRIILKLLPRNSSSGLEYVTPESSNPRNYMLDVKNTPLKCHIYPVSSSPPKYQLLLCLLKKLCIEHTLPSHPT